MCLWLCQVWSEENHYMASQLETIITYLRLSDIFLINCKLKRKATALIYS